MTTTFAPDLLLHRAAESLGARLAGRFRRLEARGAELLSGQVEAGPGVVIVTTRSPRGVILLACGPGCSALLVADHVGAGLAMGNRVVVTFVEPPSGALAAVVETLARSLPSSLFHAVRGQGEPWSIRPGDLLVVAALTPSRVTIDDHVHEHGGRGTGTTTDDLLSAYSDDATIVVPITTVAYVDAAA